MHRLEFTIEPFVEGRPGTHVTAAIEAVEHLGIDVEFGPFGSSCRAPGSRMGDLVSAITDAAIGHGASHVSLHVSAEPGGEDTEPEDRSAGR